MSTIRISTWPAQEPPLGFAARAAEAMLASKRYQARKKRPGVAIYLAVAAILATGTAMAIWGVARRSGVQLSPTPSASVCFTPLNITAQAHTFIAESHAVAEPSVLNAPGKAAAVSSARAAQPAPVPSERFPLRQPACECERGYSDFICDCY